MKIAQNVCLLGYLTRCVWWGGSKSHNRNFFSRTALEAMVVVVYYAVMVLQAGLSLALLNHHFEIVLYCQKYSQKQSFSSLIVRSQY